MQLEFGTLILQLGPDLQAALEAKGKEGWIIVPGTIPLVVYNICRPVVGQESQLNVQGEMKLTVDDTKIYIIDKDGNKVERH